MKIKHSLVSLALFFISPAVSLILSLFMLSASKNNKFYYTIISLSIGYIFIFTPPLGDLYRHYNTFLKLDNNIYINKDLFLHSLFFIIKYLYIPFELIPATFIFLSVYLILSAFNNIISISAKNYRKLEYIMMHIIVLLSINYFTIASGLRFGLAVSILTYGLCHYIRYNNIIALLFIILFSSFIHFTLLYFILPILFSIFIKINFRTFVLLLILGFISSLFSDIVFRFIVNIIHYGRSYIDGVWASSEDKNLHGKIRVILNQIPFFFFLLLFLITSRKIKSSLLFWICIFTSLTYFSYTLFTRLSSIPVFLMIFYILSKDKILIIKNIILIFVFSYFMIDTIYGYRRQILLGEMWKAPFYSPLIYIVNPNNDFDILIKEVDHNGFWIKNPVKTN
ncbi:EpsG family protein [Morganella morganii]|uniref:EpsG family protein n=2 Tax=Morganella morganii TaxID=582 RepID=UPI0034E5C1A6|nr:EpsG family protein [Morganella morganii]